MTTRRDKARAAIATIARALEGERPPVMFVGGMTTALFALPAGIDVRPTDDVDCVDLPALRDEIANETSAVASAVRAELVELRAREAFIDAVPAHFGGDAAGQTRADEVLAWLASLREG